MKTRILGSSGVAVSAIGLGCMGMSDFYGASSDVESLALLEKETLNAVQIRRIVAGLPLDDDTSTPTATSDSPGKSADKEPMLKPILPPITGGNPATA